jgi:hypothetical protein
MTTSNRPVPDMAITLRAAAEMVLAEWVAGHGPTLEQMRALRDALAADHRPVPPPPAPAPSSDTVYLGSWDHFMR